MPDARTRSDTVAVQLTLPLGSTYDYLPPAGSLAGIAPGHFVRVPLGGREVIGVAWDAPWPAEQPAVPAEKLRAIEEVLPLPPLPAASRRFIEWVARYACADRGAVLRMAMSVSAALQPQRRRRGLVRAGPDPARLTPARGRVLGLIDEGPALSALALREIAGVGAGVIRGLVKAGTLREVELPDRPPRIARPALQPAPHLTPEQAAIAARLRAVMRDGGTGVTLLDGVTGSGKTEVYFEAIAEAVAAGRQALVLLPEIALTTQWLERFEARFGTPPTAWHSDLRPTDRRRHWRAVLKGEAQVVVGARSALFLPYPDLGLIVVDEEHEQAYKQEDGVIYQARDMAVVRGRIGDFPVLLASATPSLETLTNVGERRYASEHLPDRPGARQLPRIAAIDQRREPPPRGRWLSPPLRQAIEDTLAAEEQALLFLNRRGYAPLTLCRACGHRLNCPNCSTWLVEHRFSRRLICHHCGYDVPEPDRCPSCDAEDRLVACGPGIERLYEEVAGLFPEARIALIASDTVRGPASAQDLFNRIADREIDLIIGTQIIAKGHNFAHLTLVGVVDADLGLQGGDLRAAERTFQLLHQVAGRAGREERPGRALLQTYDPAHPVIAALVAGDRDAFMAREAETRKAGGLPPFGRLLALVVSSPDQAEGAALAREIALAAPLSADWNLLGPAPAPLSLLRGRFRFRLLLKARRGVDVSELARAWLAGITPPRHARVIIDVNPYSFL